MANVAPATLTITSSVGPGQSVSALKFTDVKQISFSFAENTVRVLRNGGSAGPQLEYFDYSAITTFTASISGGITTITLS